MTEIMQIDIMQFTRFQAEKFKISVSEELNKFWKLGEKLGRPLSQLILMAKRVRDLELAILLWDKELGVDAIGDQISVIITHEERSNIYKSVDPDDLDDTIPYQPESSISRHYEEDQRAKLKIIKNFKSEMLKPHHKQALEKAHGNIKVVFSKDLKVTNKKKKEDLDTDNNQNNKFTNSKDKIKSSKNSTVSKKVSTNNLDDKQKKREKKQHKRESSTLKASIALKIKGEQTSRRNSVQSNTKKSTKKESQNNFDPSREEFDVAFAKEKELLLTKFDFNEGLDQVTTTIQQGFNDLQSTLGKLNQFLSMQFDNKDTTSTKKYSKRIVRRPVQNKNRNFSSEIIEPLTSDEFDLPEEFDIQQEPIVLTTKSSQKSTISQNLKNPTQLLYGDLGDSDLSVDNNPDLERDMQILNPQTIRLVGPENHPFKQVSISSTGSKNNLYNQQINDFAKKCSTWDSTDIINFLQIVVHAAKYDVMENINCGFSNFITNIKQNAMKGNQIFDLNTSLIRLLGIKDKNLEGIILLGVSQLRNRVKDLVSDNLNTNKYSNMEPSKSVLRSPEKSIKINSMSFDLKENSIEKHDFVRKQDKKAIISNMTIEEKRIALNEFYHKHGINPKIQKLTDEELFEFLYNVTLPGVSTEQMNSIFDVKYDESKSSTELSKDDEKDNEDEDNKGPDNKDTDN